jgi:SAM-dependent methyltransferase
VTRKERILSSIDAGKGTGLEIGALSTPILAKDEAHIFFADHMSTSGLREKYINEPVDLDKIVSVDYVLSDGSLASAVGGKKFDYVIASHVIEHIPNPVEWLGGIAEVLRPGGILSLVIPDKRYTFDITREDSTPADILGAYVDRHARAPSAVMYDYALEYRKAVIASDVAADPLADYSKNKRRYTEQEAWEMTLKNAAGKEYVDCHCHVFTPYSFMEILKVLINRGLFQFEVAKFYDTTPGEIEFFVSLKKVKNTSPAQQLKTVPRLPKPVEVRELEIRIEQLEQKLHEVLTSTSWRVTRPLRTVAGKTIRRNK